MIPLSMAESVCLAEQKQNSKIADQEFEKFMSVSFDANRFGLTADSVN